MLMKNSATPERVSLIRAGCKLELYWPIDAWKANRIRAYEELQV